MYIFIIKTKRSVKIWNAKNSHNSNLYIEAVKKLVYLKHVKDEKK